MSRVHVAPGSDSESSVLGLILDPTLDTNPNRKPLDIKLQFFIVLTLLLICQRVLMCWISFSLKKKKTIFPPYLHFCNNQRIGKTNTKNKNGINILTKKMTQKIILLVVQKLNEFTR